MRRPVLQQDKIVWQNIDGPRSLMTAWKKLISTSVVFRQESQQYLRGRSGQRRSTFQQLDASPNDFSEDIYAQETEDEECFSDLEAIDDYVKEDAFASTEMQEEMCATHQECFYDCCESFEQIEEPADVSECVSMQEPKMDMSREEIFQVNASLVECRAIRRPCKNSLHVQVHISGCQLMALVDTGATSCFIQGPLVKRLGLWKDVLPSMQEVRYGNDIVEGVIGEIDLPVVVGGYPMNISAYVLNGKVPPLIMGFTFLE